MSGKPSSDGVIKVRRLLNEISTLSDTVSRLTTEIGARQVQKENCEKAFVGAKQKLFETLEEMDVRSSGNAGFEDRATWFLTEMSRQYEAEVNRAKARPIEA